MMEHVLDITLCLKAPFLFPGEVVGRFGYDRLNLTDAHGRPVVPRDQLKGLIRHGLQDLELGDFARTLMGQGTDDARSSGGGRYEPVRGAFFTADLTTNHQVQGRLFDFHRVELDNDSGAAKEGHLLRIEQLYPPETKVEFAGSIVLFSDVARETLRSRIDAALNRFRAIGAHCSIGFGRVAKLTVTARDPELRKSLTYQAPDNGRFVWRFTLDRPFLVDSERLGENAYLGAQKIPGGVLKGLLARMAQLRGIFVDPDTLARIRFGFACSNHGSAPPVSVVNPESADDAVIDDRTEELQYQPEFPNDWKVEPEGPRIEERVHTEISTSTGGAKDQRLFSTLAVIPDGSFTAVIDANGVDHADLAPILSIMEGPLYGLGRTDAIVTHSEFEEPSPLDTVTNAGSYDVLITTAALLASPEDANEPLEAYQSVFRILLPNSRLRAVLATQRLAGDYLGQRFRPTGKYRPWILTLPGSVLRLEISNSDVAAFNLMLRFGVIRPDIGGHVLNWENCPFVRENGYGAIRLLKETCA